MRMACENFKLNILSLTLISIGLFSNFVVDGSKLHANGGYDVTVALQESINVPVQNRPVYIDNIKSSFVQLSQRMWMETNETFFISSVQIIVASTWTDLKNVLDEPTANNYRNSDFRVSEETKYPWVQNPNPCGQSGEFIELPRSFFDSANSGAYGLNSKALLVQWARYRYGAWGEHGFPGDSKFPYFYKSEDPQGNQTQKWHATGCTNSDKLVGEYRFTNGTLCNETASDELDSGCRFFPATTGENNDVTSSLMHYHFLESVNRFCDENAHDKYAPNKQNYFCDFRSVLETILSSSDFKMLNTSDLSPTVHTLKTKVVRASKLPSLYILVDRGSFAVQNSMPIINIVTIKLALLLSELSSHHVVASIGSFPTSDNNLNVKELISWRPILGNEDSFADALVPIPVNGPQDRDFGLAIQQAGEAIKKSNPDNGGVIVIFKTGIPTNFSRIAYEKSLENYLLRESIKLFSIELGLNRTGGNLESMANNSYGQGVIVRTLNPPNLTNLLTNVRDIFVTVSPPPPPQPIDTMLSVHPIIVFDEMVEATVVTKIPVNRGAELLTFHLSIAASETNVSPVACVEAHSYCVTEFTTDMEWGEADVMDVGKRFVHIGLLNLSSITTARFVSFQYSSSEMSPGQLTVNVEGSRLVPVYDISIATTAQEGVVDLSPGAYNVLTPFAIYVKVEQAGKPVVRGIMGEVELRFANGIFVKSLPLMDDGQGSPDVQSEDGIYSAVFVPPQNDFYTIRVKVVGSPANDKKKKLVPASSSASSSRLLPVDQEDIFNGGCGSDNCDTAEPIEFFTKVVNYPGSIQVKNRELYKTGMPLRIRDLTIHEQSSNFEITMEYSATQILGEDGTPTVYMLYTSVDRNNLTRLDPTQWPLPAGVENPKNQTVPQFNPGERVQFNYTSSRDAFTYFAVIAFNKDNYSPISNIVSKAMILPPSTTTTEDPSPTTEQQKEEDTKSWIKKPAGIITIVAIVLVVLLVAGVGFWYFKRKRAARTITTRP